MHRRTLYVSGKLSTYPSPKPTLTLTSQLGQNVGLGEAEGGGGVGSFSDTYNDPENVPSAVRCRHPRFRNLNSTRPVDVLREKSDVNTVKFRK